MYDAFMSTPKGSSWLVCTGPLTNAALLLSTYEDKICEHLAGICFMGGAKASGNCNSGVEFNMYADPDSAKIVIETWGTKLKKLVMVPLDVTETTLTKAAYMNRMKAIDSKLTLTLS
jgi:inosine-uridine nucleoside N-ribohydrolase